MFDYGSIQDYAWSEVLARAEAYIRVRAASGANVLAIAVQPVAPSPSAPIAAEVTTESLEPAALGAPASFASYPLRLFLGDAWVDERVGSREVSIEHGHRWLVELLAPRHAEGLWLTQQELVQHFEFSRAPFKLSSPARKFQELVPVRDLNQPAGGGWSLTHQLVGLPIAVHLPTTADNARALRTRAGPVAQKGRATQLPQHTAVVGAVRSDSTVGCWSRVQDDLGLSVLVLGKSSLVEGTFARELPCRLRRRGKGSARRIPPLARDHQQMKCQLFRTRPLITHSSKSSSPPCKTACPETWNCSTETA